MESEKVSMRCECPSTSFDNVPTAAKERKRDGQHRAQEERKDVRTHWYT